MRQHRVQVRPLLAPVLAGPVQSCQDVAMAPRDLDRLARVAKARRLELGLARNKTAAEIGISKDTWKRVEQGQPVREMNYAKIDAALGWAVGSCLLVAEGGHPVPSEPSDDLEGARISTVVEPLGPDAGEEVARAVQVASLGTTDLSAEEIRELSDRVVEDLRKRGIIPG